MRRAAKVDRNQAEIVKALRQAGASVLCLHTVGQGCPDLLVDFRGKTRLIEIKDGDLPPSARKLTPDELRFSAFWTGPLDVVMSPEEALDAINEDL